MSKKTNGRIAAQETMVFRTPRRSQCLIVSQKIVVPTLDVLLDSSYRALTSPKVIMEGKLSPASGNREEPAQEHDSQNF